MKMKADFRNYIIFVLIIGILILGMITGTAAALGRHHGNSGTDNSYNDNSDTDNLDTDNSDTDNLDTDNLDTDNLDTDNLDTDNSDTDNLDTDNLDTDNLDTDNSGTDNSKADNSGTDNSGTDNSGTDNSKADNSVTDNSKADNSGTDNSKADNSGTDNSNTGYLSTKNTANLSTENSSAENSSAENPGTVENLGDRSSSFSSSSSHSGMGLFYREPATNVVAKELITRNIANGNHIKYDFKENSTCIIYIEYDAERTFLKTTTTVEELKNKSTFVSKHAPGRLYKYVNVWVGDKGGGLPTSLKNGSIGFRVEKAWINNSTANINDSFVTIQLYNKSNTSWEPLYTEKTGEDNNYMYFKSTTPGFSSFAITTYTGVLDKNGTQVGAKLQDTLTGLAGAGKVGLNGSANNSKAQEARSAAKMLMAISLPLFLIFVGYLVVKKKL